MIRELLRPRSLEEALALKDDRTAVVAGGTDVVPLNRAGALDADRLLDLTFVPGLGAVATGTGGVSIGAGARADATSRHVSGPHEAVADGAALIGSAQTRAMATLVGNVCRASPAGDTLAPLLACSAQIHARAATGRRAIPAREFFLGPGRTALTDDEIVVAVSLPDSDGASAYQRATVRRAMDLATVGVAVALVRTRADRSRITLRVAVSGAGPTPVLVPGTSWGAVGVGELTDLVPAADAAMQAAISPIDDARSSAWYRRRMAAVLLRRALDTASARLGRDER